MKAFEDIRTYMIHYGLHEEPQRVKEEVVDRNDERDEKES